MKVLMLALVAAVSVFTSVSFAGVSREEATIRRSEEFKSLESSYKKIGGALICRNFKVVSSIDLKATLLDHKMFANTVVADCRGELNDDGDPVSERLLAIVTVTHDNEDHKVYHNVVSCNLVSPPQPD